MKIYCCGCEKEVDAKIISGKDAYPHRQDLFGLPFWKCEDCNNFVGCHHKTKERTRPLGCIPTIAVKQQRRLIHAVLDPLWQSGKVKRKELYTKLSKHLGRQYHTAELRSVDECQSIIEYIKSEYQL